MGIGLQGDGGAAVAETGGDGNGVDSVGQQDGGAGVAQVVEADAFKAVGVSKAEKPFGRRIVMQTCVL